MNKKQIAKRIVLTIAWFLIVLWVVTILMGCATSKPDFKPLAPEKLENLLFQESTENIAYKSVTHDDYIIKEDC